MPVAGIGPFGLGPVPLPDGHLHPEEVAPLRQRLHRQADIEQPGDTLHQRQSDAAVGQPRRVVGLENGFLLLLGQAGAAVEQLDDGLPPSKVSFNELSPPAAPI